MPVPPLTRSWPVVPTIVSLPAPPLRIGWSLSLVTPVASIVSAPSRASIAIFSPCSGFVTLTVAARPVMVCVVPLVDARIVSAAGEPVAVIVSTRRSAVFELTLTVFVAVPVRSPTFTLSVPPNGATSTCLDAAQLGRPLEAVEHARGGEQPEHVDEVVRLGAGGHQPIVPRTALDVVGAVRAAAAEAVVAVAEVDGVVASPAGHHVPVRAAAQRVRPVAAVEDVDAGAAVERDRDPRGGRVLGHDEVDVAAPEDRHAIVVHRGVADPDVRVQALHAHVVEERAGVDVVEAVGPLDGDLVARAVGGAEVGVEAQQLGRPEVAEVDEVLPAGGDHVERLDAGGVGRRAGVAGHAELGAVGLDGELLGLVRADRLQRVLAQLTVELVEAVALDHGVVAVAQRDAVVAAAGVDEVGVVAGRDRLGARAAGDGVGAGARTRSSPAR